MLASGLPLSEAQIQVETGSGQLTFAVGSGSLDGTGAGADALLEAAAALRSGGIAIADVSLRQPSLDEAFLALTGGRTESDPPGGAPSPAGAQS